MGFHAGTFFFWVLAISVKIYFIKRPCTILTHIECVVTPSGNSGHVVVPKAWIGKEAIVTLKEKESRGKDKKK
jgi:putative transposon-encoded protein